MADRTEIMDRPTYRRIMNVVEGWAGAFAGVLPFAILRLPVISVPHWWGLPPLRQKRRRRKPFAAVRVVDRQWIPEGSLARKAQSTIACP